MPQAMHWRQSGRCWLSDDRRSEEDRCPLKLKHGIDAQTFSTLIVSHTLLIDGYFKSPN